jgi:hypothetical protein
MSRRNTLTVNHPDENPDPQTNTCFFTVCKYQPERFSLRNDCGQGGGLQSAVLRPWVDVIPLCACACASVHPKSPPIGNSSPHAPTQSPPPVGETRLREGSCNLLGTVEPRRFHVATASVPSSLQDIIHCRLLHGQPPSLVRPSCPLAPSIGREEGENTLAI